jgi:hypothetical protein
MAAPPFKSVFLLGLVGMAFTVPLAEVQAKPKVKLDEKTTLSIQGTGVAPNANVILATGPGQALTAVADKTGAFTFDKMVYVPSAPLSFNLTFPVKSDYKTSNKGKDAKDRGPLVNNLRMDLSPYISKAVVSGDISRAGSVVVNLAGEDSKTAIANSKGKFSVQAFPSLKRNTSATSSKMVASVINVVEDCCPRSFLPVTPITLVIQSDIPTKAPLTVPAAVPKTPSTPYLVAPSEPTADKSNVEPAQKPKSGSPEKKAPATPKYIVIPGSVSFEQTIKPENLAFAVGGGGGGGHVWVDGLKEMTSDLIAALVNQTEIIGTFFDARNDLAAQRTRQVMAAGTMKDYQVSEALCRFGTLSRSLAASDSEVNVHKIALSEILQDRDVGRVHSMYARSGGEGFTSRLKAFEGRYCDPADNNNGLFKVCQNFAAAENRMNFDIDYTRMIDTPLTINASFTDSASTSSEEDIIALLQNISLSAALENPNPASVDVEDDIQDLRAAITARGIARNSFTSLIAQKLQGSAASATYMKEVLKEMGVPAGDADKLIGANPSYYAQMEILTKKLYQDPDFIANLYDTPANVGRQRSAVKALSLQQGWDLAENLRRRELLLSALLELKLRNLQATENTRGASSK